MSAGASNSSGRGPDDSNWRGGDQRPRNGASGSSWKQQGRGRGKRGQDDPDFRLRKDLSMVLRQDRAEQFGVHFSDDGFLTVDELLHHQMFHDYKLEDIKRVVDTSYKQLFTLRNNQETNILQIGANSSGRGQRDDRNRRDDQRQWNDPGGSWQQRDDRNRRDDQRQWNDPGGPWQQRDDRNRRDDQRPYSDARGSWHQRHDRNWRDDQRPWNDAGGSWQSSGGRGRDNPDVRLSKNLSLILRHRAEDFGFHLEEGGFLTVDDLLRHPRFRDYRLEDVKRVVENNDKKRFAFRNHPESNVLQIRANQGHTVKVEGLDLKPITDASEYPTVIHGTYYENWLVIKKSGLSRRDRNHIHFAPGEPGEDGVISGMRQDCEVIIFLDLENAMKDGLEFLISANSVILSAGNQHGLISVKYFKDVIQTRPIRQKLPFDVTEEEEWKEPSPKAGRRKPPRGQIKEEDMTLITDASQYPNVVHGTYNNKWKNIEKRGIPSKGKKPIFLAEGNPGEPGDDDVISEIRRNFHVMIFIDMEKAMKDDLKFYVTTRKTIICHGNEKGLILPKYFKDVIKIEPTKQTPPVEEPEKHKDEKEAKQTLPLEEPEKQKDVKED